MSGMFSKKSFLREFHRHPITLTALSLGLICAGAGLLWIATFRMPDLNSFESRRVAQSTKIYDRTGEIVLYDVFEGAKRTVVPFEDISRNIKNATVAIEDDTFYEHMGVRPLAFLRAVMVNLVTGSYSQGGSTITQQVVKNALLTKEKKISRKLKEWVLAFKLEKMLSKEEILAAYLNETPYGGNIYGVEEASKQFFAKSAKDLTIAESAYLAAIPQATTYYSPYGKNREALEERKNLVLERMKANDFITEEEYEDARAERVEFQPPAEYGIRAPHFVMFVKEELEERFGEDAVLNGGLRVITTLDYALQEKAEEIVKKTALANKEKFDAENAALVAIDPKTGDILAMVGSRDYFDEEIDGNYNIITGKAGGRQPGSSFKPIVYAQAFAEGYTPETVLFDLQTEFSSLCDPTGKPLKAGDDPEKVCYRPVNYDDVFRGPITLRGALAQSLNVPSVKLLYLAGIQDALDLARNMGITTLKDRNTYGLTLVLGGGEVTPLELTSAYGTFANDGTHMEYQSIISVENPLGGKLYTKESKGFSVLDPDVARTISDILSDNEARTPAYSANSPLYFPGYDVAAKTGTTNDYRDAWTIGYTPFIVVGAWAGNNDNSPMQKKVAGQIVAPMWSEFMRFALGEFPRESFQKPLPPSRDPPPVLRGIWQGGESYEIDTVSGKRATEYTPDETKEERVVRSVHSILYWIDKDDPLGGRPARPQDDPQFERWEKPVRDWALANGYTDETNISIPTATDDVHRPDNAPTILISGIEEDETVDENSVLELEIDVTGRSRLSKALIYLNGSYLLTIERAPFEARIDLSSIKELTRERRNEIRVVGYDSVFNRGEAAVEFDIE